MRSGVAVAHHGHEPALVQPASSGECNGDFMTSTLSRRTTLAAGASALAMAVLPTAFAQSRTKLRFSSAFTEQDLRAEAYRNFANSIKDRYDFEPYWGNTLFKQGTEL